jgi:Protein of unknown function (DUF3592)
METTAPTLIHVNAAYFSLLGIAACIYGVRLLRAFNRRARWHSVQGKISRSQLVENPDDEPTINLQYDYQVNGIAYCSYRVVPDDASFVARDVAQRYVAEMTVTVYYNPDNPNDAVLERKGHFSAVAWIILGIIVILYSVALAFGYNLLPWLPLSGSP